MINLLSFVINFNHFNIINQKLHVNMIFFSLHTWKLNLYEQNLCHVM